MRWVLTLLLGMMAGAGLTAAIGLRPAAWLRNRRSLRKTGDGPLRDAMLRPGTAELAGSLAHELSQPLTAITSNAQAARAYLASGVYDPNDLREILDDIINDASRASEIVRGVRALVLGEAPRMVPFSVADVVEQALELVQANARARGVTMRGDLAEGLPRVVGDPVEIRLVLLNLLVNALDAVEAVRAEGDRVVSVFAALRDGAVRLAVHDNGCGVADDDLDRIFRPFYSSKPKGMGLGLSFSRALMERNGGRIHAIRNNGRGMTFECVLRVETPVRHAASASVVAGRYAATYRRG